MPNLLSEEGLKLLLKEHLVVLVNSGPRCRCGGECELLEYLAEKITSGEFMTRQK